MCFKSVIVFSNAEGAVYHSVTVNGAVRKPMTSRTQISRKGCERYRDGFLFWGSDFGTGLLRPRFKSALLASTNTNVARAKQTFRINRAQLSSGANLGCSIPSEVQSWGWRGSPARSQNSGQVWYNTNGSSFLEQSVLKQVYDCNYVLHCLLKICKHHGCR